MVTIRKAELDDKESVNDAHIRSIREICSKDYNNFQIEKWSAVKYTDEVWSNTVSSECCYVILKDEMIEGVCHSRVHEDGKGEIVGLYLSPEVIGLGFGKKIYQLCLNYIKERGSSFVFVNGTKTAKGFYEKMGFELKKEFMANIRGADIETYYMELRC